MEFKPRPIYVGFVVEKVALEYNALFALHFSRKSINLPNSSYSFVPLLPALMLVIVSGVKHYNYKVVIFLRYLLVDKKENEKNKAAPDCTSQSIQ